MAISSPGIGSGLDISGIISKLMQVEQQPLNKLNTQEASYQSKISALGSLQGAVSSLNSALASLTTSAGQTAASKFIAYKASLGDSSIGTASADSKAATGTYSLEVSQLASAHRLSTIARAHTLTTFAGT
jgi:flagellar hook-associated protein 2